MANSVTGPSPTGQQPVAKASTQVPACTLKIGGTAVKNHILSVVVDRALNAPASLQVELADASAVQGLKAGASVELALSKGTPGGAPVVVFQGEVVGIEFVVVDGRGALAVRAADRLHRLAGPTRQRLLVKSRASDVFQALAADLGIQATIDATATQHEFIVQAGETDLEFLLRLALAEGRCVLVDGGRLLVKALAGGSDPPSTVAVADLRSLRVSQNMQGISGVKVVGWGWTKAAVAGQGEVPATGEAPPYSAGKREVLDAPTTTSESAVALAKSLATWQQLMGWTGEGSTFALPDLKPGGKVKITGAGDRHSRDYFVWRVVHRVDDAGGHTTFHLGAPPQPELRPAAARHLAIGVVTDNRDPDKLGRVRVKFAAWSESGSPMESAWARVVAPGGGKSRGLYFLPEVDDEVVVAFESGDLARPLVIGGLWSSKDAPPRVGEVTGADGQLRERVIQSRTGHVIVLDDGASPGAGKIVIRDGSGKYDITLDAESKVLTIRSDQDLKLVAKRHLTLQSETGSLLLDAAAGKVALKSALETTVASATNLEVKAAVNLDLAGTMVRLNKDGLVVT